jgi:hypothetical protein
MQTRSPAAEADREPASGSRDIRSGDRRDKVLARDANATGEPQVVHSQERPPTMAHLRNAEKTSIFAGVDWGGSFHQLCLVDADGKTIFQKRFHHTVAGLEQLQEAMTKHPGNVRVAIERSEGLLVERLQQLRMEIYCVSPKISARARERYRLATKKSDAFDAFVLADTLRHEHAHWRPLSTPSALLARIRALSRDREQSAKTPHWTGALYETARAGQGHHRALRGIAARWVRILWRCWQDNTPYDVSRHPHRREALHQAQNLNPAKSTAGALEPEPNMA